MLEFIWILLSAFYFCAASPVLTHNSETQDSDKTWHRLHFPWNSGSHHHSMQDLLASFYHQPLQHKPWYAQWLNHHAHQQETPIISPDPSHVPTTPSPSTSTQMPISTGKAFRPWLREWLQHHYSNCGDQPIEPVVMENRIVGGTEAVKGSWPWTVSLYSNLLQQNLCGGTIIASEWIITAAHCFTSLPVDPMFEVRAGLHNSSAQAQESSTQVRHISNVFIHPQFNKSQMLDYDLALVRLRDQLDPTDYVKSVCLPQQEPQAKDSGICITAGWGRIKRPDNSPDGTVDISAWPQALQQTVSPLINRQDCRSKSGYGEKVTDQMICAGSLDGSKDTCNGDSGGPLMCIDRRGRWALTGVTSWTGSDYHSCAVVNQPGVYTDVFRARSWILFKIFST